MNMEQYMDYVEAKDFHAFFFGVPATSMLYVGWKPDSNWKTIRLARELGIKDITILEIHPTNAEKLKESAMREFEKDMQNCPTLRLGDILDYEELFDDKTFDIIAFYHGPEHIREMYHPRLFSILQKASVGAFVGVPLEEPHHDDEPDPRQHRSTWKRGMLEKYGFKTIDSNGLVGVWFREATT